MPPRWFVHFCADTLLLLSGCSSTVRGGFSGCEPMQSVPCTGDAGCQGRKTCLSDGTEYGSCVCTGDGTGGVPTGSGGGTVGSGGASGGSVGNTSSGGSSAGGDTGNPGVGGGSGGGDAAGCLRCNAAYEQSLTPNNPTVCASLRDRYDSFYSCVCSSLACGGVQDYPCQSSYCEGSPISQACRDCIENANSACASVVSACKSD